jgi:hypothetical protein
MKLFLQFVLAFAVAGWCVEWILNPATKFLWEKVGLWAWSIVYMAKGKLN